MVEEQNKDPKLSGRYGTIIEKERNDQDQDHFARLNVICEDNAGNRHNLTVITLYHDHSKEFFNALMNIANLGIKYPDNDDIQKAAESLKREIKRLKHGKFGYIKFPLVSFLCLVNEVGMFEYIQKAGITAKDITDPETLETLKNAIVEAGIERSIANCNRFCRYVADAYMYLDG